MELLSISAPVLDIHESFGQDEMNDLFKWLADYEEDNVANAMDEASTDSSGFRCHTVLPDSSPRSGCDDYSLVVSEKKNRHKASIKPYEVDSISQMTYWLDNDNRIYRMDVEGFSVDNYESIMEDGQASNILEHLEMWRCLYGFLYMLFSS
eukprot:gene5810-6398_t